MWSLECINILDFWINTFKTEIKISKSSFCEEINIWNHHRQTCWSHWWWMFFSLYFAMNVKISRKTLLFVTQLWCVTSLRGIHNSANYEMETEDFHDIFLWSIFFSVFRKWFIMYIILNFLHQIFLPFKPNYCHWKWLQFLQ